MWPWKASPRGDACVETQRMRIAQTQAQSTSKEGALSGKGLDLRNRKKDQCVWNSQARREWSQQGHQRRDYVRSYRPR